MVTVPPGLTTKCRWLDNDFWSDLKWVFTQEGVEFESVSNPRGRSDLTVDTIYKVTDF